MKLEKYKLRFNAAQTAFEFVSEGPKGNILKGVYYSEKELLNFYAQEPSEKQMQQLKDFMFHLFNDIHFKTRQTTSTINNQ